MSGSICQNKVDTAQKFRPTPDIYKCSAFVEGQAFYLLGGISQENFILDLSAPWNTSDPAYKKLGWGWRGP